MINTFLGMQGNFTRDHLTDVRFIDNLLLVVGRFRIESCVRLLGAKAGSFVSVNDIERVYYDEFNRKLTGTELYRYFGRTSFAWMIQLNFADVFEYAVIWENGKRFIRVVEDLQERGDIDIQTFLNDEFDIKPHLYAPSSPPGLPVTASRKPSPKPFPNFKKDGPVNKFIASRPLLVRDQQPISRPVLPKEPATYGSKFVKQKQGTQEGQKKKTQYTECEGGVYTSDEE